MKIRETWAGLLLLLMAASAPAGEPQSFKLAALKLIPKQWDKDSNLAKLEEYARRAAAAGAALVVTPEGYLEGYVGNTKFSEGLTMASRDLRRAAAGQAGAAGAMTRP